MDPNLRAEVYLLDGHLALYLGEKPLILYGPTFFRFVMRIAVYGQMPPGQLPPVRCPIY